MSQWYDIDTWQWTDNSDYEWGFATSSGLPTTTLNQIWADENYVYMATMSGLSIFDIVTESQVNYLLEEGGYNSVWASDTNVYLASEHYGIKYFDRDYVEDINLSSYVISCYNFPDITSDTVKHLHGKANRLFACSTQGLDIIRMDNYYITHNTTHITATKTFITPNFEYYYYNDGTNNVERLNGNSGDWSASDTSYVVGSGFMSEATEIKDFYVTEHTSTSGLDNTLFVATDLCIYAYDEGTGEYKALSVSTVTTSGVYSVIGGSSTDFVAVWADPTTSIASGRVYVASTGSGAALSVIELSTMTLVDNYTTVEKGATNEELQNTDIADIYIGGYNS